MVLQSKGTPSARRKLKKIAGRERRFVSDINHRLSKAIAESDYKVFVLEDLHKMTNRKKGRKFNRKLGNWSFGQFGSFLEYKLMLWERKYCSSIPNTRARCALGAGIGKS